MNTKTLCALLLACIGSGCATTTTTSMMNPAAPGFNAEGSDARAIALADRTMAAMGGRDAWDKTRYLAWNFFGARRHVWDRFTGDVRIEGTQRDTGLAFSILMNIDTRQGRAWLAGAPVPDEEHDSWMQQGYEMWVNDSYWLVMPYKLKDSGVTLRSAGSRAMDDGRTADVVTITFEGVGVSPENRYDVFIARDTKLVEQWSYYATANDAEPRFTTPWADWRRYGAIMLSGSRGERKITDIAVLDELPAGVLQSAQPIAWPVGGG